MADAVAQGADCIITLGGIQSSHCRASAVAAKYLNLDCYLILRTTKVILWYCEVNSVGHVSMAYERFYLVDIFRIL